MRLSTKARTMKRRPKSVDMFYRLDIPIIEVAEKDKIALGDEYVENLRKVEEKRRRYLESMGIKA